MTEVDIVNRCSVLTDAQVKPVVDALQIQVTRDFWPIWGAWANLHFVGKTEQPNPQHWAVYVLDTSDEAGTAGYHDYTFGGQPMGKAFAKDCINRGQSWTVCLSHELLEMLGDPDCNRLVMLERNFNGGPWVTYLYAYENCDACEADKYGYQINGVLVSDFVFPQWFEGGNNKLQYYDFTKHITQEIQILPGGYISAYDFSNPSKGFHQIYADGYQPSYDDRARLGSRREKRKIPIRERIRSTAQ